jgi:hypothetical protein
LPGSYRPERENALIWPFVRIDITPEPSPEERTAIERALATTSADRSPGPSAWWRDGLREAVGLEGDEAGEATLV